MEYTIILTIVLVFYLVIPGVGAVWVRQKWKYFRKKVLTNSLYPLLKFHDLRKNESEYCGNYRFFGQLQAMGHDEKIWISNQKLSVKADLKNMSAYILPSMRSVYDIGSLEHFEDPVSADIPQRIHWSKISTLSEKSQIFISGPLYKNDGQALFKSDEADDLLLILYDGEEKTILRRAIWGGRHKNEYWNIFTPISLVVGSFMALIYAYMLLRIPVLRPQALFGIVVSLVPVLPVLPPGILFFLRYKDFWKKGRLLRAERDILLLPKRFFRQDSHTYGLDNTLVYKQQYFTRLDEALMLNKDFRLRFSSVTAPDWRDRGVYAFFTCTKESDEPLAPEDPMLEELLIPGNPVLLSEQSSKAGHRYEVRALFFFFLSLSINFFLAYQLLLLFLL